MGYTTHFEGSLSVTPQASSDFVEYINKFSSTRRMGRDVAKLQEIFKGEGGFDGNYGENGEYFVGGTGFHGQEEDDSILNYNGPPTTQPSLWCQWVLTEDGENLEWDGGEKFYYYVVWLEYMIKHFFEPKGHKLNGEIQWFGESQGDFGTIYVKDNKIQSK